MSKIQKAIDAAGGAQPLAKSIGVPVQSVYFWRNGERRVPFEYGAAIETATGGQVTRQELFPEAWERIWPELKPTPQKEVA